MNSSNVSDVVVGGQTTTKLAAEMQAT